MEGPGVFLGISLGDVYFGRDDGALFQYSNSSIITLGEKQ